MKWSGASDAEQSADQWAERSGAQWSGAERNEAEQAGGAGRENKNPQKFLGLLGVLVCF